VNISAPFIKRPIGTLLLTLGVVLIGVVSFLKLPVAPLPKVDIPTIQVQANLPGASPATMASTVAGPLERHLGTIAGVNEMTSKSTLSTAQITLQFDLGRDIDGAARDVQAAIAAARADLPSTLKTNPTYRKINPAEAPIMILTLTSRSRSPDQIYDAVSNIVQQKLLQVNGVGNVELGGAALPSVRIEINPTLLARDGLALEDVRTALQSVPTDRPRGVVESITTAQGNKESGGLAWQVYSNSPAVTAKDYAPMIIAWRHGAPVRLMDIGTVLDAPEDVRTMGLYNGKNAVPIIITRQPDANIVQTVDAINAQVPALRSLLPEDIKLAVASDRTITIRASLVEVEVALLVSTLLVVVVVSLFLQSWRATLIPAAAIIVSLLGTLGVMYMSGFLLDNLSLMALTVATGFVVDDAIVVVENIARHVEDGMQPGAAAMRGAREIGFTVLSISISLIAVFIPLVFMGGILGRLLREFALTMSAAVAISLLAALTVTPMLASRLLDSEREREANVDRYSKAVFDRSRRFFEWLQRNYARQLDWALRHRGPVLLMLLGAVLLNIYCLVIAPKGLLPQQDTGSMAGGLRIDQSLSFHDLSAKFIQIERIVRSDPAVKNVVAFAGGGRAGSGFMFVILKPRDQRVGVNDVITRLRPQLARVRGVSLFLNPVQDLQIGGRQTTSMYQYVLYAESPEQLADAGDRLVKALKLQPTVLTDVDIDQQDAGATTYVTVDRDRASSLGISTVSIDNTLYDAFGQRQVANIYKGLNQYHVVMEVDPAFNGKPEALNDLYLATGGNIALAQLAASANASLGNNAALGSAVSSAAETLVPLATVGQWASASTNAAVSHSNGEPSATVSFNLPPSVSLGQASKVIAAAQAQLRLPATVHGDFGGTAKVFQQSTGSIPLLIVAAIAAIYIVLGILYESAIHPLTVLSTLPSAGLGAIFALIVTGGEFDIIALIGIILLIGIVKKNAILIIDFAIESERQFGMAPHEAIREACLLRFRPILMTTLAAAFGALPLAIGFGDGAELRRPLGIAIVGGLLVSQVLTLLTTPVVYLALDKWRKRSPYEHLLARHGEEAGDIARPLDA
jgi:multidrug efflux pump